tara:strand:- start:454 stop:1242 length:789 start_codon:yes stop_codon:yes gene_type:complete
VDIVNAIILGIIQGLTEFLPVSSSGHLEIFKVLLSENKIPSESLLMTVVLHFATACSTMIIFKEDIKDLVFGLLNFEKNDSFWFSVKILVSMIPAALIGFFLESEIELLFSGDLMIVGAMLIITGILLFLADKAKPSEKKISIKSSIIIGISQAIAIIPGISRSGATISTAVLLGIDKENAAKFSFLMVVPLIFGKVLKDLTSSKVIISDSEILPLIFGFIFAFVTGILACTWMIKLVKNSKLKYFSIYCFLIGLISIISTL